MKNLGLWLTLGAGAVAGFLFLESKSSASSASGTAPVTPMIDADTIPAGSMVFFPGSTIGTTITTDSPAGGFPVGTTIQFANGQGTGTVQQGGTIS
jgi:hypothetical protein